MKNGTLQRFLVALSIAFAFAVSGCISPASTTTRVAKGKEVLEPIAFDIAMLHNKSWSLTCLPSEDSAMDSSCDELVNSSGGKQFTRILHANEDGQAIKGLAVWSSQAAFQGCGSIDLTDAEVAGMAGDGVTFDNGGVASGPAFVDDQVACETKDGQAPEGFESLLHYVSLNGAKVDGVSYTSENGGQYQYAPNCLIAQVRADRLFSYDGVNLVLVVIHNDQAFESAPGACAGAPLVVGAYSLLLTRQ